MAETSENAPAPQLGEIQLILRSKDLSPELRPEYPIIRFPATIGRHPTNDIEIPFEAISRYHARIELHAGRPRIVDLYSSNGVFVNGDRVQTAQLSDHDLISLGGIEFTVAVQIGPAAAPPDPEDSAAVHFIIDDDASKKVFQAELPDDTTGLSPLREITNAEELQKAQHKLTTLYRLQEIMRSTKDEPRLLRRVLDLLFGVLPIDRGVILLRDPGDPQVYRPKSIKTKPGLPMARIGISRTILMRCAREKVALLTQDAPADERFDKSDSIVAGAMRSVLCVPLLSARQTFGFIHLDTSSALRSFNEDDLDFMASAASELATHLHNLRMMEDKIAVERMAAIGQTITGMAHNIKNILALTQGGFEVMEKRIHSKSYESLEETWEVVRRGLGRINTLVQDMLDYSRARVIDRRRVDINSLLLELSATFADDFAKRGIDCKLALDEALQPMMLDADGLEKSLVNLLVNAAEAMPEDRGRIDLRTRLNDEGNTVIEVEDNGSGIPKEVMARIFIPFFTTKGSKGSGLGLAMSKKFIEDMGGRIEVESRPGIGSRFQITLHISAPAPRLGEAPELETQFEI